MKIDNVTHLTPAKAPRESSRSATTATADSSGTLEASADISRLRRSVTDNSQDIDAARVEELRRAISEGRLEIRADKIAKGLIDSLRELLEP